MLKKAWKRSVKEFKAIGGELIYLIRYTLIPEKLLGTEVAPSGLLSDDHISAIFQRVCGRDVDVPFCTQPRHVVEELKAKAAVTTSVMLNYLLYFVKYNINICIHIYILANRTKHTNK